MSIERWDRAPHWLDREAVIVASVTVPPGVRRPTSSGSQRLDVEFRGFETSGFDDYLSTLDALLRQLPELVQDTFRLAPPEWRHRYVDEASNLDLSDLWLDTVEFDVDGTTRLDFDFGDLDILVLEIDPDGVRHAYIRP